MVTWYLLPHNHFSLLLGHFNGSSLLPPRSCYTIPMLLPDSPEELLPSSVIPGMLDNRKISRAVIDNAILQYMLPRLQPLLDRADSLAHSAESEGVALDATKYLIDRIAGKAKETIDVKKTSLNITLTQEQVDERLAALRSSLQDPPAVI